MVFGEEYSKQMIASQMGKAKFGQRLKAGSKEADAGVPIVVTYHLKLTYHHRKL